MFMPLILIIQFLESLFSKKIEIWSELIDLLMSLRVECNASIYQIVIFNDSYIHDLLQKMLVIMSVALLKLNLVHKTCSQ
jgi:hypothetical protein